MPKDSLDEREFELVNIIGAELGSNQRDLSRLMDLSLGMVNMLIRRLISKGFIRINQLNKRKVEYLLTPKGFAEKMRKSVQYTFKTVHSISAIKESLKKKLTSVVEEGERNFTILGESDFAILVEIVLRELCGNEYTIQHIQQINTESVSGTLLICKEAVEDELYEQYPDCINLVEELAKDYVIPKLVEEIG
ncbi:MAG: winged helix-turn-helix transcriptional regulator [Candidatus Omnitrophica bacterium]|nr:winged helix-turn-helix transcriptional regulator [Candidatus Omnitrophota bacterium]MCA9405968.1 winged helix-turn-helix transcriptional regulator [Candidatus Omnitrophota bacterium]